MMNKTLTKVLSDRIKFRTNLASFMDRIIGYKPTDQQSEACKIYDKLGRIIGKSGHLTGKTTLEAAAIYQHLYCWKKSIVVCTAPTKHQLNTVLWTEAGRMKHQSPILNEYFEKTATKIFVKGELWDIWYAQAVASSNPSALAGRHDKHLLYVIDEVFGLKEEVFPVIEGALSQKKNKVIMMGNPVKNHGYAYELFREPLGYGTITMSSIDSGVPDYNPDYHINMGKRFGINSNIYRVRVLGEFPTQEDDSILEYDLVEYAMQREEPLVEDDLIQGACDAARYGDDRIVFGMARGYKVTDWTIKRKQDTVETQNDIVQMIKKFRPSIYKIDAGTFGIGIIDNVRRILDRLHIVCDIIEINFGGTAIDDELYENISTEMHFQLQETLKIACIPKSDELLGELTTRKYFVNPQTQRVQIQSKEDLRKDAIKRGLVGFKSPDEGDTLAMLFYKTTMQEKGLSKVYKRKPKYNF